MTPVGELRAAGKPSQLGDGRRVVELVCRGRGCERWCGFDVVTREPVRRNTQYYPCVVSLRPLGWSGNRSHKPSPQAREERDARLIVLGILRHPKAVRIDAVGGGSISQFDGWRGLCCFPTSPRGVATNVPEGMPDSSRCVSCVIRKPAGKSAREGRRLFDRLPLS